MCQVLKLLSQLFHGQFGLILNLQFGQFPQHLAATQSTQHRLPCLGETAREVRYYVRYSALQWNWWSWTFFHCVSQLLQTQLWAWLHQERRGLSCVQNSSRINLFCKSQKFYHLPEESGHLAAVLEDGPDEKRSPGEEAAPLPIQAVSTQQLTGTLGRMKRRLKTVRKQRWQVVGHSCLSSKTSSSLALIYRYVYILRKVNSTLRALLLEEMSSKPKAL